MNEGKGFCGRTWTPEEVAYLHDHYATAPAKEIAAHLGRSYNAVIVRANIEGLKSRHRSGVNSLVKNFFQVIDTPEKAYLLGLLAADGSVSKKGQLKLELHEKDIELVELMRDRLAPGARISHYKTKTSPMVRFMVAAPGLVRDLASHGVVNAKTLITSWPEKLPSELENSFTCGYYDGDGSLDPRWVFRWAVVSGNIEFLATMQERIRFHTGVQVGGPYRDKRHEHAWSIIATGEPVRVLDAWLHRDVLGLARKRLASLSVKRTNLAIWGGIGHLQSLKYP